MRCLAHIHMTAIADFCEVLYADGEFHGVKIRILEDFFAKNSKVQWLG